MAQSDYLRQPILDSVNKYLIEAIAKNTRIEFAKNGNSAGILGAFYNFIGRRGEVLL